ncbi:hypothetical protein CC79DRAFT_1324656 [Sarocladium strictum]
MSKIVRKKAPAKKSKPVKRRLSDSSTPSDLSDEYGYSGVEDISDSEDDDEEDVNAVEEDSILKESFTPPRPAPIPDDSSDDNDADDDEEEEVEAEVEEVDADDNESTSWAGIVSEPDEDHEASDLYADDGIFAAAATPERHVHFDVPYSDSDSTATEDDHADIFPDIFVDQHSLDPSFRREIEDDAEDSSGSGGYWDYRGHYEQFDMDDTAMVLGGTPEDTGVSRNTSAEPSTTPVDWDTSLAEPAELDGYETDGETTEEDEIPEPIVRKKSRRPSLSSHHSHTISDVSDSDGDEPKRVRGQPRTRRVNLDRSDRKPIAVLNPVTRKMMIFTPHRRRQLDLSPEQFNVSMAAPQHSSPLFTHSANMMLSAMLSSNALGDFLGTTGPEEAFFPVNPVDFEALNTVDYSSPPSGEDEDDGEKQLDISDFITWDDDGMSSADEDPWEPSSTPMRPTTASSNASRENGVLSHLNSSTVGAFRQNQINQQLILSNQATQDSLAFSGPYNVTTIKGLKSDRFDTAAAPLTPVRRQKRQIRDFARSPLETVSAKRKASTEVDNGHKRQRSISDVNNLRI